MVLKVRHTTDTSICNHLDAMYYLDYCDAKYEVSKTISHIQCRCALLTYISK